MTIPKAIVSVEVPDVLRDVTVSLAAAISLLERGSKKAAPSNAMFDQMLLDYKKSLDVSRSIAASAASGRVSRADLERTAEAIDKKWGFDTIPGLSANVATSVIRNLGLSLEPGIQDEGGV